MKVILTENVENLGSAGDLVQVKRGFYRNYLQPRKLAVEATNRNVKQLEHQKRLLEARKAKDVTESRRMAEMLENVSLTLTRKAGEQDKLFGSVTDMDIAEALQEQGYSVERKHVRLEEPIKMLGVYQVPVKLAQDMEAKVKVWVIKE